MIEGSEELKAYFYEASQFERVDTILNEGSTYNAVYMIPPKVIDWHHTHGGPQYVEVGKDIDIQYHTRMNVTHHIKKNATNSSAAVDITQTVEEDVVRTWVYYEYDPSSVEYYYYKDCIVKDM
jgi:hypothetical protein